MLTSEQQTHKSKQSKIRYTEYYDLQSTFDRLYADSLKGKTFHNLIGLMASEENIKLAYRTIKGNKGSGTPGVDKRTIKHLASMEEEKFVRLIQKQFSWYNPRPVRRVEIPKPNGKTRPLGIPTIVDRIVQQCILQVLEPICEAKFHERSNGFRPNRSTEHAIAQCCRLMQIQHLHYAVDLDIHGFFDNVHHGKLIRQMWELGIRDKKLLCIIKQMLKAPIVLPDGKRVYGGKPCPYSSAAGKRCVYRGRHRAEIQLRSAPSGLATGTGICFFAGPWLQRGRNPARYDNQLHSHLYPLYDKGAPHGGAGPLLWHERTFSQCHHG